MYCTLTLFFRDIVHNSKRHRSRKFLHWSGAVTVPGLGFHGKTDKGFHETIMSVIPSYMDFGFNGNTEASGSQ
jgi:hypothetical protein